MRTNACAVWAALVVVPFWAAAAAAQVKIESHATEITITGRLHTQWNTTSVDGPISNEFLIRRARLTAEVKINDLVSGKIQPDYGEGELSLKDAYVRLSFDPAFRATLGQFKRPFDVFELTSSTQILVVERGGGIRGLDTCPGVEGICSFSRFTEALEYADRDIGVLVDGAVAEGWRYMLSVTNGTGADAADENGDKSFSGRIEFTPLADLTLAANVGSHDYEHPVDLDGERATAFGVDVEWGNYSEGLHVQAGVVIGDNWLNLDTSGEPSTFRTAQGIVTYKVPLRGARFLEALEPVGRISWGDPDDDADDDCGVLFTPGLVAYFTGRNKLGVNADIWAPSAGDTELSIKIQSYLHF